MNVFLVLAVTLTVSSLIVGSVILGGYLGHVSAKCLSKNKPRTLAGRLIRDYRVWAVLAGLLMCGCVMAPMWHVLVAAGLLPLMVFALIMADSFEPGSEPCGSCGL